MKTGWDFTKVPLDKWVDFYNAYIIALNLNDCLNAWRDINKYAEIQVKEEADYNKDLAEAYTAWISSDHKDMSYYDKMQDAYESRKKLLGITDKPTEDVKRDNAIAPEDGLTPVENIIK